MRASNPVEQCIDDEASQADGGGLSYRTPQAQGPLPQSGLKRRSRLDFPDANEAADRCRSRHERKSSPFVDQQQKRKQAEYEAERRGEHQRGLFGANVWNQNGSCLEPCALSKATGAMPDYSLRPSDPTMGYVQNAPQNCAIIHLRSGGYRIAGASLLGVAIAGGVSTRQ